MSNSVETPSTSEANAQVDNRTNVFKADIKKILHNSTPVFNLVRISVVIAVLYIIVMTYAEPFTYMQGRNPTTDDGHKVTHELQSVALLPALLAMCLIVMNCWSFKYAAFLALVVVAMLIMFYSANATGAINMSASIYDGEKIMAGFMIALAVALLYTSKLPHSTLTANLILAVSLAMLAARSTTIHASEEWEKAGNG